MRSVAISMRPKLLQQATENWQGHLGGTEIRIGVTKLLRFLAMANPYELGGSGWNESMGPSWSLGF